VLGIKHVHNVGPARHGSKESETSAEKVEARRCLALEAPSALSASQQTNARRGEQCNPDDCYTE
jgi:hypothetical protein